MAMIITVSNSMQLVHWHLVGEI